MTPSPLTPAERAELRRLWEADPGGSLHVRDGFEDYRILGPIFGTRPTGDEDERDGAEAAWKSAAFALYTNAARTALPKLLDAADECDRLRAGLERVKEYAELGIANNEQFGQDATDFIRIQVAARDLLARTGEESHG